MQAYASGRCDAYTTDASGLAGFRFQQGDKAKAVQMLERAVENEPSLNKAKTMSPDLKGAS